MTRSPSDPDEPSAIAPDATPERPPQERIVNRDSATESASTEVDGQEPVDGQEQEFSLEDLSAAYAKAMEESGWIDPSEPDSSTESPENEEADEPEENALLDLDTNPSVDPLAIVEAALFVGHPDNVPLTAAQIAATMRGVSQDDVLEYVTELNQRYERQDCAFRVFHRENGGLWLGIAEAMRPVRSAFYGKIRESRLTQSAVDVLALVTYQPGITGKQISQQRGKESVPILSQLVRRELIELRREDLGEGKPVPCYYPTPRLFNILGLSGTEDLPTVNEVDIAPSH